MIQSAISEIFVAATGFDRHPIEFYRYDIGTGKIGRLKEQTRNYVSRTQWITSM